MKINFSFAFFLLIIFQTGYSINPSREYKLRPEQFKIEYEELKIKTADNTTLNTWVMKSNAENKKEVTFIIVGSDAGNMGYSLAYVWALLKNGYDVITFDYRGFGESSDFDYNPNNQYHTEYVDDFVSILDFAKKDLEINKISILAFSMGTLVSVLGYERSKFDFFVGEGCIYSAQKNIRRIKKRKGKQIISPKEARFNKRKIKRIGIPILLFAGEEDQVTTLGDSKKIVNQKANRKLVTFEGGHLAGARVLCMEHYMNEINEMFANFGGNYSTSITK